MCLECDVVAEGFRCGINWNMVDITESEVQVGGGVYVAAVMESMARPSRRDRSWLRRSIVHGSLGGC